LGTLPACNQLLGISNPVAGDATEPDGPRPDGPAMDAALDAPPACTTSSAFGAEITSAVGGAGVALQVARFDNGNIADVAVAITTDVAILLGTNDGSFGSISLVGTPAIGFVVDDFDLQDVRKDLVMVSGAGAIGRRQNPASPGTFLAEQPLTGPFNNVDAVGVGAFDNGNITADLVVHDDSGATVFEQLQGTPGTFSRENTVGDAGDKLVFAGTIDRENNSDALFVDATGNVKLAVTDTSGVLQPPTIVATGATGLGVGVGLFDDDNFLDLVVATVDGGEIYLQNSASPGVFTKQTGTFGGIKSTAPLLVGDINGDGLDDVVTPNTIVMQCPTTRVFTQVESINAANGVLANVDGNSKLDLLRLAGTDLIVRLQ